VLTLSAQVFENGSVKIEADADRKVQGIEPVLDCLRQVGPRVLARAPSSVNAKIVLDDSVRRAQSGGLGLSDQSFGGFGGLVGSGVGTGLGTFGIGRGGGGRGPGAGLGSIGGLSRGGASGARPLKPREPGAKAKASPKK
jgi:hypothetical protein